MEAAVLASVAIVIQPNSSANTDDSKLSSHMVRQALYRIVDLIVSYSVRVIHLTRSHHPRRLRYSQVTA